jgi:hypothetical protein
MLPPAAFADRRKFGRRNERARIGGGADHRRDDGLGTKVKRTADGCEIADGEPDDRCRTTVMRGGDAGERCGGVPQAVLLSKTTAA